jgi:hypothetical protein
VTEAKALILLRNYVFDGQLIWPGRRVLAPAVRFRQRRNQKNLEK